MEASQLFTLIQSFSPVERREIGRFLRSPFFNQRQDLVQLFDWLCHTDAPAKEETWQLLFPQQPYDDQKLRLHLSYLNKLLEQYLIVKESQSDELNNQRLLASAYRKRNLTEAFEKARKTLEKQLQNQPERNAHFHEIRYQLLWESHQHNYTLNPTDISALKSLSTEADVVYLGQKLRLVCLLAAHQSVYQAEMEDDAEKLLLPIAERNEFAGVPAVAVYLVCYRMLRRPLEEAHFFQFKEMLLHQSRFFSTEEMHGLYIHAVNYCVKKINAGAEKYSGEVQELYKTGIERGYLFENGVLRRFTYYNIVASGIQANELEWVRHFIYEYKNKLEKKYRESLFSFNLARLEYAEKKYDSVLNLLQNANYRDVLLNLSAKTLLLKTYFALAERDALESHMDAMRNFIHRKRVIGYHKTNYLNIVRYMEKLIRLNPGDKSALEALANSLQQEEVLSEKHFFLSTINQLSG